MKTLEVNISFNRDYFTRHFGLTFGNEYFEDIRIRMETEQAMQRCLYNRFGDIGLGNPDPPPVFRLGYDDTLNVTLMFGGKLQFTENISWIFPGFLYAEEIHEMTCPRIEETFPHTQFLKHFNTIVREFGQGCIVLPVPHGILEAAFEHAWDKFDGGYAY